MRVRDGSRMAETACGFGSRQPAPARGHARKSLTSIERDALRLKPSALVGRKTVGSMTPVKRRR
jgi:hypothetical protein